MTYDLYLGDATYSSWSMRGWLLLTRFGLPTRTHWVGLYAGTMAQDLAELPLARTVPVLRCRDGAILTDSLAIAETLSERHPDLGFWPEDAVARATARSLTAEMHSGFMALRGDCPMNLGRAWVGFQPSDAVLADLARIETLWAHARAEYGGDGPWLFGRYCIADAFFAPVAGRIAGYDLPVGALARSYVETHLADDAFRQWRAIGASRSVQPEPYTQSLDTRAWPGPAPLPASVLSEGKPINEVCPFSGKPVSHFVEIDGRILGFCNPGCRDKVAADPLAWPQIRMLLDAV